MSLEQTLIDEIVTDLNNNAGLPAHQTAKYRRPRFIMPDDCPLLVVWLIAKQPSPITTERFDAAISIGASWHEEVVEELETLVQDDAKALALIDARAAIEDRARALSVTGLTGSWEIYPGASEYMPPENEEAMTEGFAVEIIARVTEG